MATTVASTRGTYTFLDVGALRYGDCIVVQFGSVRVLIDGSHEKDFDGQDGYDSTPEQLKEIFKGEDTPYPITLLVVTHCHQDHIGALPELVHADIIRPQWALITDHRLGFGRTVDDSDAVDLANDRTQKLAAALREEDATGMSDVELQEFMDTVATAESKYHGLLANLKAKGVKVIEYQGQPLPRALLDAVLPSGMTLLGPSKNQLLLAAEQISRTNKDASDAVRALVQQDAQISDVDLYRTIVAQEAADVGADASDFANPRGNGMNCQSITLAFGPPEARALLAGDMQFADPGVSRADREVEQLLKAVQAAGPYKLYKTTHHTSFNGQDDHVLDALGSPPIIVHTGGLNDPNHPDPKKALPTLKHRAREIVFARTDRNGQITVQPDLDPKKAITVSKGGLNDFTDNASDQEEAGGGPPARSVAIAARPSGAARRALSAPQVVIVNLPPGPVDMSVAGVDILTRTRLGTRVLRGTPPVDVRPSPTTFHGGTTARSLGPPMSVRLAGGRTLPKLLFLTDSQKLSANIGRQEAQAALAAVSTARGPHLLLDVAGQAGNLNDRVRQQLQSDSTLTGVVILGGYDVIPSVVTDVLPKDLRSLLGDRLLGSDGDRFVIWSDESYGDLDGDAIGELPVSRIPDARDSTLFLTALQVSAVAPQERFGVRNIARPFADTVWSAITGHKTFNVSKAFLSTQTAAPDVEAGSQYFMLHGSDSDGTLFSGEDPPGYTRAFTIDKVPPRFNGIVFSGCCWGALTVSHKAVEAGTQAPAPRVAERSIALSYLKAGASAFVGCTGSHYSGTETGEDLNYAQSFHEAFWKTLPKVNYSGSLALFGARRYYGNLIGSGTLKREPLDLARRLKNRAQFTCLGLGW